MSFELQFTDEAKANLLALDTPTYKKQCKAIRKALGYLQLNPKHPSLQTHKFTSLSGPNGEEIFEAYAQNHTPAAYRIFWLYGPRKKIITIIAITPHP